MALLAHSKPDLYHVWLHQTKDFATINAGLCAFCWLFPQLISSSRQISCSRAGQLMTGTLFAKLRLSTGFFRGASCIPDFANWLTLPKGPHLLVPRCWALVHSLLPGLASWQIWDAANWLWRMVGFRPASLDCHSITATKIDNMFQWLASLKADEIALK